MMTEEAVNVPPVHIEPNPGSPTVSNPAQNPFNVTVTIPETISIRMVDASGLSDYEYHVFAASLFSSFAVGFLIPTVQEYRSGTNLGFPFLMVTVLFAILFAVSAGMAFFKRRAIRKTGREIKLITTGAALEP